MFPMALSAVKEAQLDIKQLDFEYYTDGVYAWASPRELQGLRLGNLETLLWRPRSWVWRPDKPWGTDWDCGSAATDLMLLSSQSLERLKLYSNMYFPTGTIVELPKLASLEFESRLMLPRLADFVSTSRALRELQVHPVGLDRDLRDLWYAPNVCVNQCYGEGMLLRGPHADLSKGEQYDTIRIECN